MKLKKLGLLPLSFALLGAGLVAVPASAQAETVAWNYSASTGGTYVNALGGTVNSDLTAASSVTGGPASRTSKNSTLSTSVGGLATVGAIETRTSADVTSAGTTLTSWAKVAGVDLLSGLIKVDAVETRATTVGKADGTVSYTGGSQLAGIKIAGYKLPADIPKNYALTIPNVATVSLNYATSGSQGDGTATLGWALGVQLLKPRSGYGVGTTIILNPINQFLLKTSPVTGATLGGYAYGTKIAANVGEQVKVISDPTAQVSTPFAASGGRTLRNATAAVNVPGVLTLGAVTSTSTSSKDGLDAEIVNTNQTARLNLLDGLITADAIEVTARGKRVGTTWTGSMSMTLLNLVIAGRSIPVNVSPNTALDIAGLGKVELNRQVQSQTNRANTIHALRITLDTAQAGLPVGAVIEVGVAATMIY